ncbi:uncharacterized protein LOC127805778 [Diospyros lotus]|uniref:uncharacterized protein LOC127805778 n=1 Tax=Diospyros lotus TaxID=55363 RepID=UPI0022548B42|nr:uncharacterized protein LOC127805778 [Diospyros lotus]
MRRTTRVVGARVLKSGRRLLGSKNSNGEEWGELSDNSGGSGGEDEDDDDLTHCKLSGWRPALAVKPEVEEADIGDELPKPKSVGSVRDDDTGVDRMWGSFYRRKRKRMDSKGFDFEGGSGEKMALVDKRLGKNFDRRKKKDSTGQQASVTTHESSACCCYRIAVSWLHELVFLHSEFSFWIREEGQTEVASSFWVSAI